MRSLILGLITLCIAGLPMAVYAEPEPEPAPTLVWKSKDGWSVFLYRDADETFNRCSTVIEYTSGRILAFSVDYTSHLIMRISHKTAPVGQPGQQIKTYLRIDNMEPRTAPAVIEKRPNGSVSARTDFLNDYKIFGNLRRGYVLDLSGDLGEEQVSLKGSAQALRKMADCVPRPFTRSPVYRIKPIDGPIISVKMPVDPSRAGAAALNVQMQALRNELLAPDE